MVLHDLTNRFRVRKVPHFTIRRYARVASFQVIILLDFMEDKSKRIIELFFRFLNGFINSLSRIEIAGYIITISLFFGGYIDQRIYNCIINDVGNTKDCNE
jgi:hypothetical protein